MVYARFLTYILAYLMLEKIPKSRMRLHTALEVVFNARMYVDVWMCSYEEFCFWNQNLGHDLVFYVNQDIL